MTNGRHAGDRTFEELSWDDQVKSINGQENRLRQSISAHIRKTIQEKGREAAIKRLENCKEQIRSFATDISMFSIENWE